MPKKFDKLPQNVINDLLLGYVIRSDARILAFESTLSEVLKLKPEQTEEFSKIQDINYKLIYQQMIEDIEKLDPSLAARLIDGQDIYSGLV